MELPLELDRMTLDATPDNSRTRLMLAVPALLDSVELDVQDVQQLAGALMQWLADNQHALPAAPAGWVLLEQTLDLTEPGPLGTLTIRRERGLVLIDRADEWVLMSGELLGKLRDDSTPDSPYCEVDGLTFRFRDSAGATVTYVARPDLPRPLGTASPSVILQRVAPMQPATGDAVQLLPEHTR